MGGDGLMILGIDRVSLNICCRDIILAKVDIFLPNLAELGWAGVGESVGGESVVG